MTTQVFLTTTGTLSPVTITTLGGVSFVHPTVSAPLIEPEGDFTPVDIFSVGAVEIQANVTAGHITLVDENGNAIPDITDPAERGTYPALQDEGVMVTGAPHTVLNFTGAGVTVVDAGSNVSTITIPGGVGSDELVKVSANDTTAGRLVDKLIGTANKITFTETNDGLNETYVANVGGDIFDTAADNTDDITQGATNLFNQTHTGDVTGATALTITADAVDNTKLANMPANTIKSRPASSAGDPQDLLIANGNIPFRPTGGNLQSGTPAQIRTLLNVEDGADATPSATETTEGKAEIATQAEVDAQTDDARFITPLKLENASNVVHTDGDESIAGLKTFTNDVVRWDPASASTEWEIGFFPGVTPNCFGVRNTGLSGYFCFFPNATNPQLVMGSDTNVSGSGFIDVDNNRPLNLNTLDTGAGTPAVVNIGSGGLNINTGGNITLGATNTVDGVDVGSPKNSIEVDSNAYQLAGDVASPGNNKVYGTNGSGTRGWYDPASVGGGGILGLGEWEYESGTGTPPDDEKFRFNNATPASATLFYIDYNNDNGNDLTNFLQAIAVGAIIYAQEADNANNGFIFEVSSNSDSGTYATIGINNFELLGGALSTGDKYHIFSTFANPGANGDVTASANITDNAVVRGDGGSKGIQDSSWTINDTGLLSTSVSRTGYVFDAINTLATGGGNGFKVQAGEVLGDIAFHIADSDDSFQIMEMEADQGFVTLGQTYAQTLINNGVVYGMDNQHPGVAQDFNTQFGQYRTAGIPIPLKLYELFADQVDFPNSADWAVNAGSPASIDTNNSGLTVRLFDDTVEEGIGFMIQVPKAAQEMTIRTKARAETTPGGGVVAVPKLYKRAIPDNGAVAAWSSPNALTNIDLTTNELFQYDETNASLATWGLTAGELYQFEFTRDATNGSDTLVGDLALIAVEVEFN